jgi:biofilm PGA synthesis N-glycosyltransferase PgaC
MTPTARVLLISPVRDEADHIERVANALAAQTRPPDHWIVADDGSRDATPELLRRLAGEIAFLRVLEVPPGLRASVRDGLALASEARAFNWALARADDGGFTHVGKLDGDIELRPAYLEGLLAKFAADPRLGVAGGVLLERRRGAWRPTRVPLDHVRGAVKVYTRECLAAIGGVEERLGWDTIDETYARMRGFETRSFPDLEALHHRPVGTAAGAVRGRARHGRCAYVAHQPLSWVVLRAAKVGASKPVGLSGAAFLGGYLRAWAGPERPVEDEAFRRFVRGELRDRLAVRSLSSTARSVS